MQADKVAELHEASFQRSAKFARALQQTESDRDAARAEAAAQTAASQQCIEVAAAAVAEARLAQARVQRNAAVLEALQTEVRLAGYCYMFTSLG